jgi:hypothetical protein
MSRKEIAMRIRLILLLSAMALLWAPGGAASGQDDGSALIDWLAFVPATPQNVENLVYFGDLEAWHTSWGVPRVSRFEQLDVLDPDLRAAWMFTMPTQLVPPEALGMQYLLLDEQRPFYGFDIFAIDRLLSGGAPPDSVTVLEHRLDPAAIGDTLIASGYEAGDVDGGTLYSMLDDYEISFEGLPRVGSLGQLNRIALVDDRIIIGRATAPVTGALAAAQGETPSLAAMPMWVAGAKALDDPALDGTGELVAAMLWQTLITDDPLTMLAPASAQPTPQFSDPLPVYTLLAFGTRHTEGASYLVLAVVFPPDTDAAAAADILAERLQNYVSLATREPLADRWTFDRTAATEIDGWPVALAVMRVDDPAPAEPDQPPARVSISWSELIFRRDLGFLIVGEPLAE